MKNAARQTTAETTITRVTWRFDTVLPALVLNRHYRHLSRSKVPIQHGTAPPPSQWADDGYDGYKTTTRRLGTIKDEMTLRLTEAELAGDIHAVLARVRDEGLEVIVVHGSKPVAIIRRPEGPSRKLSECIAIAKAYEENLGYAPLPDADFAVDVQAAVNAHCEPPGSRP